VWQLNVSAKKWLAKAWRNENTGGVGVAEREAAKIIGLAASNGSCQYVEGNGQWRESCRPGLWPWRRGCFMTHA
jgi:hypothetical protein